MSMTLEELSKGRETFERVKREKQEREKRDLDH